MWRSMAVTAALVSSPVLGAAQSVLDRPPDLSGGWVGEPGQLHFHFMHRFAAGPAPARKVTNTPTFLLGVPAGAGVPAGFNYATNSAVARGRPNEWELFGRWAPVRAGPWRLAIQAGYNLGAESADGEVTLGGGVGPVDVFGVGRVFSGWRDSDDVRFAAGAGARLRVTGGLALAGDVVGPVDLSDDESPAWSAGLQLVIPYTPHSLSLHASNAVTTTLHGSTVGAGSVRYGFEFTIPVTLRRYLPSRSGSADAAGEQAPSPAAAMAPSPGRTTSADTVEIPISGLAYGSDRVKIRPGATVVWVNDDPVAHTATAEDGAWDSDLIAPGDRWGRTFTGVGEHPYHCTPHPFMKAVIVVTAEGEMD